MVYLASHSSSSTMSMAGIRSCTLLAASLSLFFSISVLAQPATLGFQDCFFGNVSQKLNVSTVYAQLEGNIALNLTVIGYSNLPIVGRSNSSTKLGVFLSRDTIYISYRLSTPSHIIHFYVNPYNWCMDR